MKAIDWSVVSKLFVDTSSSATRGTRYIWLEEDAIKGGEREGKREFVYEKRVLIVVIIIIISNLITVIVSIITIGSIEIRTGIIMSHAIRSACKPTPFERFKHRLPS